MNKEKEVQIDWIRLSEIIEENSDEQWSLIPMVQKIQKEFGYIPPQAIPIIAAKLKIFPSQVQGVISFYAQLYTEPRGRNTVRVCRGTACHVRGGKTILKLVKQHLGVDEGGPRRIWNTHWKQWPVSSMRPCPNLVIGNQVYGNLNLKSRAIA